MELQDSQKSLGIDYETKPLEIKNSILLLTKKEQQRNQVHINQQSAELTSLKAKVDALLKEYSDSSRTVRIVRSLYFQEVRRRFDQIPPADQLSNSWVYDPNMTTFGPWLESSADNDGLFYIWGKVCMTGLVIDIH
jgi:hypothetical protein